MKDIKILVSGLLILTSFFLWISFERAWQKKNMTSSKVLYINIVQKSNGFDVIKNDDSIHVLVNNRPFDGTGFLLERNTKK
jgi:hypothetical protein